MNSNPDQTSESEIERLSESHNPATTEQKTSIVAAPLPKQCLAADHLKPRLVQATSEQQPDLSLPPDTHRRLLKREWGNLVTKLNAHQCLSAAESRRLHDLTRQLMADREPMEKDYWQLAKDAGAFTKALPSPRCSKAEMNYRIHIVVEWILEGWDKGRMLAEAVQLWGVGQHTLKIYIQRAHQLLKMEAQRSRAVWMAIAMSRINTLWRWGRDHRDPAVMSRSIDQLAKVAGLYTPQRVIITRGDF